MLKASTRHEARGLGGFKRLRLIRRPIEKYWKIEQLLEFVQGSFYYIRGNIKILIILSIFQISFLIRFSSKTNQNRRFGALGPEKSSGARSGDHFALGEVKFGQI